MRKIFISYRRVEAEVAAGALGRDLRRLFGDEQVFRDKEDIGGGVSWKKEVLHEISKDSALLVLIGKGWADATDARGRRLDNSDDPLRLEITAALNEEAFIILILLENAEMPSEEDLPPELQPLPGINALKLNDDDWPNVRHGLEAVGSNSLQSKLVHREVSLPSPFDGNYAHRAGQLTAERCARACQQLRFAPDRRGMTNVGEQVNWQHVSSPPGATAS